MRKQPLVKLTALLQERIDHEEAVIRWVAGRKPEERRWWHELPEHKRIMWRIRYDCECLRGYPIRPAGIVDAQAELHWQETKRLAESWAEEIRTAFKERRPCPIIPEPKFQHVLDYAFQLAAVPPECVENAERVPQNRQSGSDLNLSQPTV